MKLRNKKTGEIGYFCFANWNDPVLIIMDKNGVQLAKYNSLTELNAEWEDYEEPENFYIVEQRGTVGSRFRTGDEYEKMFKEIGNYFETKEEAEKAVEELKAYKRLKDKGFRFDRWNNASSGPYRPIWFYFEKDTQLEDIKSDLDLLFSGEDD